MDDTDIASSEIHGEFRPLGQSSSDHVSTPDFDTNGKASSPGSELRTDISTTLTEEDKDYLDVADWKAIIGNFVYFADPPLKTIELQSNDEDNLVYFADPPLKTIELQSNDDNYLSFVKLSGSSENTVVCEVLSSVHEDTSHSTNGQPENTNELLESGKDTGNGKRKHLESEKDTKEEKKNCKGLKSEEDKKKGKGKGREREEDEKKMGKKSKEEKDEDKRIYAIEYRKNMKEYKQNLENKNTELENEMILKDEKIAELENIMTLKDEKIADLQNKLRNFEKPNTLNDQMINDLQGQVVYPENKITSLNLQIKNQEAEKAHKISTMSHSHVVSGNYPKVSPSQNVIKENELKEMIHQAEALAMDPEIFLKFMNDWLVKKGMSEIRLGNERSGFLPSLREEERSFKTRIIKTYRKIMYDKRYFEQIRQDCEFIGLE
ncbi:golgin subfamily A member 6-like protein 22 isoform X2 [Palaemon carinicauda]|uniref:golgin subfamily A member 6-like protein 22 isoform X2 n=1 Tax=Palaemon carinicauda TaxID=392227 RepID=UPI0035B5BD40